MKGRLLRIEHIYHTPVGGMCQGAAQTPTHAEPEAQGPPGHGPARLPGVKSQTGLQ